MVENSRSSFSDISVDLKKEDFLFQQKRFNSCINKFFWGNCVFTYGLLFLIFSLVFRSSDSAKFLINLFLGISLIVFSIGFNVFYLLRYIKDQNGTLNFRSVFCENNPFVFNDKFQQIAIYTSLCVPAVGMVLICIFRSKQRNFLFDQIQLTDPKFKKPSVFVPHPLTIMLGATIGLVLIVWLIYVAKGSDNTVLVSPGILNALTSPIKGFVDAADLIIFIMIIGGFLQIVNETKALEAGIGSIIRKLHGKEIWMIPVLMPLFALAGTLWGFCEESLPFYFIILPVFLAAGFDAITGLIVILFGAGIGVACSVINPFVVNSSVDAMKRAGCEIQTTDGIIWRVISFVILVSLFTTLVTLYARKVRMHPELSPCYANKKAINDAFAFDKNNIIPLTKKHILTLTVFGLTFLTMIFAIINWERLTGFTGFSDFNKKLMEFFPFIFNGEPIGNWYLIEMSFLFVFSSLVIGMINWTSESNFISSFLIGCKDFVSTALVIAFARGLSILFIETRIDKLVETGLLEIFNFNKVISLVIMFLIFLLLSCFITSTSGFASLIFPVLGPALVNVKSFALSASINIFSYANGFVNMCCPTSGILMVVLNNCKVSLVDFYKATWKMLLIMFVALFAFLLISIYLKQPFV